MIAEDPTIPELPIRDVVFRIYRDIRFSKDPTPYKPHYSAAFSRTGRKGPYACYYVHCDPGSCFVGGGLWMPDAGRLAKLRASIDERPQRWRRVLAGESFRRMFLPGAKEGDEEACVKAFAKHNKENALKTKPKVGLFFQLVFLLPSFRLLVLLHSPLDVARTVFNALGSLQPQSIKHVIARSGYHQYASHQA